MSATITTLLIVTVFGGGGPPGTRPFPFPGVTVNATYPSGRVATLKTDRHGRAYLRVVPGAYRIQAEMRPPISSPTPCATRSVTAQGRVARLWLGCSIK